MKNDGVQIPYKGGIRNRRTRALARLQEQLKSGVKSVRNENLADSAVIGYGPLNEKDISRIKKEIEILKSKI